MKSLIAIFAFLISIPAYGQTYSVETSLNNFSVSYNHTPDNVLFASLTMGRSNDTYGSASLSVRPISIQSKQFDFVSIEPFVFFEYGFNGETFNNYGFGAIHKVNDNLSVFSKYSDFGLSVGVSFKEL